jgi:hypothetical protein
VDEFASGKVAGHKANHIKTTGPTDRIALAPFFAIRNTRDGFCWPYYSSEFGLAFAAIGAFRKCFENITERPEIPDNLFALCKVIWYNEFFKYIFAQTKTMRITNLKTYLAMLIFLLMIGCG